MSAIHQEKPVNHGCTSEDRKQLPLGQWWCAQAPCALCLNLNALQSVCVCVHFKRAINMAKRLASKNSLQMLSYSATPYPSTTKNVNSFQRWVFWEKNCSCETLLTYFNPHFQHPRRGKSILIWRQLWCFSLWTVHAAGLRRSADGVIGSKVTRLLLAQVKVTVGYQPALVCFCSLVANQYH